MEGDGHNRRPTLDPRVARGMRSQLQRWRERMEGGATRVGWKIGLNAPAVRKQLSLDTLVVGYLTSASFLTPGAVHSLSGGTMPGVEPEVAIHIGRSVEPGADWETARAAIAGLGPALEIIDLNAPMNDVESIVANNIYHRAVLFGPSNPQYAGGSLSGITARTAHNGIETATVDAAAGAGDLVDIVRFLADFLGAFGEHLLPGDRIISGSLTPPIWVSPGDTVAVDFGPLGALEMGFAA